MWWTEEEELLQVQAEAAGAAFPDLLGLLDSDEEDDPDPDPEDVAEDDLPPSSEDRPEPAQPYVTANNVPLILYNT
jgi:hypothetical protein